MSVHIVHLYPESLGLFGDAGNVLALRKRSEWRGIDARVSTVERAQQIPGNADVYVIGSGSSSSVRRVGEHIDDLRDALTNALARDASVLAIGAGLHLLSERVEWADGSSTTGAGIVNGVSVPRESRLVGEFVGIAHGMRVAGFVNTGHKLETDLPPHIDAIQFGKDDDEFASDGVELGVLIGTHSHGSYLPMNPHIADAIISRASGVSLDTEHPHIVRADYAANRSREAIAERLGL